MQKQQSFGKLLSFIKWAMPTFLLCGVYMKIFEDELRELILPLCDENNIMLHDLRIHSGGKNRLIKLTVDTERGITLSECQQLTKQVNDLFFRKNVFSGNYRLEITSPGIQKPLEFPFEFRRNIGRDIEVFYLEGDEIKVRDGELKKYNETYLSIQQKNGESVSIPLERIKEAKIKLRW